MPTSAAGSDAAAVGPATAHRSPPGRLRPGPPGRAARGFTLIELLVVVAIMAFALGSVSLALRDSGQAALDREAERLAALLEAARAQSRASGATVRWRVTEAGFAFDGLPAGSLPSHWLHAGIGALPLDAAGTAVPALQLGPEPLIAAQQVLLSTEGPPARSLRVASDGLRPFAVVNAP